MSSETTSQELRGAPVAKAITEELAAQVQELRAQGVGEEKRKSKK